VTRDAFDQPRPDGRPLYASVPLTDGDAAVLAVSAVREDPTDAKVQDEMFKRQLAQQSAMSEAQDYAAAARASAKVSMNLQALD
jgi:hypothetical protein